MMRKLIVCLVVTIFVLADQPARAADPNDSEYRRQYGPQQMNASDAWAKSRGEGVVVAVVDTGVDRQHPEFNGRLVPGYDFGDNDDDPDDDSKATQGGAFVRGHGTGGAGIIAAATNNGKGIAAVSPDAKIMPLKVASENALAIQAVPQAINYAVANGAKVINLSIGALVSGVGLIGVLDTPCAQAFAQGALCVVSSGNDGTKPSGYGRSFQGLLVTANDSDGNHAPFAQNADTQWGVSSAGVAVYMPDVIEDGSWQFASGTSFSAPHASGVAALLFAQGLTNRQVVDKMMSTATPMEPESTNGAGMVNAARAVGAPIVTPYAKPSPPPAGAVTSPGFTTRGTVAPTTAPARPAKNKPPSATPGAAATTDTAPGKAGPDYGPTGEGSEFFNGEEATTSTEEKPKTSLDPRLILNGFAALLVISTAAGTWSAYGKIREAKRLGI